MPVSSVEIDGSSLDIATVELVARQRVGVLLSNASIQAMDRCRAVIDRLLHAEDVVYGLTTGFGALRHVRISRKITGALQQNLIESHACGVGDPLPEDVVRAIMLLRLNTLAKGYSGIRSDTVQALADLVNHGIFPLIPEKGSVGASGDLAPLSHLALVLTGKGEIYSGTRQDEPAPARPGVYLERVPRHAFTPVKEGDARLPATLPVILEAKEGLALNNGTQVMTAIAALTISDARALMKTAQVACAMSYEAIKAVTYALDARVHEVRPHQGQIDVAANLRRMLQGSQVLNIPINFGMAGQLIHVLDSLQDYLPPEKGLAEIIELRDVIRSWCNALASEHQAVGFRMPVVSQWRRTIAAHIKHLVALWSRQETDDKRLQSLFKMGVQLLSGMLPDIQPVQDDYSFRCAPQVLGAALAALEHAAQVVTIEINAATDNPLIFPPDMAAGSLEEYRSKLNREQLEAAVCSGGNFHGEIIALCMDYLAIALAEVGSIAERRIAHLVDQNVSNGLPAFLVLTSGSNSGFMLAQYTAAALVSENKCLAHPAGVDSIPTSANTEDHVSMGTISARKARQILEHVEIIVAIELLCAAQGMDLRAPLRVAPRCDQARSIIRREIPFLDRDRPLYKDIEAATHLVRGRILSGLLEE